MKLKNLKDLEEERYYKGSPDTRIYSWRLKQEAIKWVEHLHNRAMDFRGVEDWIINFFNITEEDLK
ncbi:MAG TPA: hypothetical protein ENG87_03875 [Candidatus Pacearchaeota archaeon]|nr:hypothetical protein [Candidatus Pacearchaeota archaeon]